VEQTLPEIIADLDSLTKTEVEQESNADRRSPEISESPRMPFRHVAPRRSAKGLSKHGHEAGHAELLAPAAEAHACFPAYQSKVRSLRPACFAQTLVPRSAGEAHYQIDDSAEARASVGIGK
jgi:hypothetical protein